MFAEGRQRRVEQAGVAVYWRCSRCSALRRRGRRCARAARRAARCCSRRPWRWSASPRSSATACRGCATPSSSPLLVLAARRARAACGTPAAGRRELRAARWRSPPRSASGLRAGLRAGARRSPSRCCGDALEFHLQANLLADGKGYIQPFLLPGHGPARGPRRQAAAVSVPRGGCRCWAGGRRPGTSSSAVLAGTGTDRVVGLVGRRVAGPRAGLIAAGLAAAYPLLVAADGSLRSESVYALCLSLVLLAALRLREAPVRAPRRRCSASRSRRRR